VRDQGPGAARAGAQRPLDPLSALGCPSPRAGWHREHGTRAPPANDRGARGMAGAGLVASWRPMACPLEVIARAPGPHASAGILHTAHGTLRTPASVPLATKATVRGLVLPEVREMGYDMVLGNTYHLFLDPGHERIRRLGGLHEF